MSPRLGVTLFVLALAETASGQQAIILVRHAEKATESNEPTVPLSDAGRARAERLAGLLSDAGVTAVYATDTVRARATAEPLAKLARVEIRTYATKGALGPGGAGDPEAGRKLVGEILAERLRAESSTGVVLVVGHSNTVPELLRALGHVEKIEIPSKQYDDLFIVVPKGAGPPTVMRFKY